MITATITAKGQITIPVEIRKALGLDAGARIEVHAGQQRRKRAGKLL